jgi:two-component system OmpR family response regulator
MTRILLVEDEDDIREVAQMALELDPDFEVRVCSGGEDALGIAREWRPDLILLDVMMPGLDGPQTLVRLRGQPETASAVVVFITARTQSGERKSLEAMGVAGIIAKPFDPMALSAIVRSFLPR